VAGVLGDPTSPAELKNAALEFLLKGDYPDLAGYIVQILPKMQARDPLRKQVLDWLTRHPEPAVLSEVVKLWAEDTNLGSADEQRYRDIVERISGKGWEEALLEGINTPSFFARGSALEVLSRRMPALSLRQRIMKLTPKTDAAYALQTFIRKFDYLPSSSPEFISTVSLYVSRRELLDDAGRMSQAWHDAYSYNFQVRDFHILSRLARDPLRTDMSRKQLVTAIASAIKTREHVAARQPGNATDNFWMHIESLSMCDLWNIYLLNEMLMRPRVQMALRIMAERDRSDRRGGWGGLVFYENGQAEAKLYPPVRQDGENDLVYTPSRKAILDSRDSLCRFWGHFEQVNNVSRAGPNPDELQHARMYAYYGLILTSINESSFCAHYFNPSGTVVSLGVFPFRK
jgi:hypothetical protein